MKSLCRSHFSEVDKGPNLQIESKCPINQFFVVGHLWDWNAEVNY